MLTFIPTLLTNDHPAPIAGWQTDDGHLRRFPARVAACVRACFAPHCS